MTQCSDCEGNVSHGKTCHRCGRKGPLGQGWQMRAVELEAENADLRERLTLGESAVTVIANDLGNIRQSLGALDGESTVDAAARVGAEVSTLHAQLATPLRLGRGPTAGEIEKHGDHGKWLVKPRDTTLGWVLRISKTIRDNPDLYTDAIALTDGGHPCPVGGWGETP